MLRPYQALDVAKLIELDTAGVFNEQRTGKTPTILTTLVQKGCKKVIVVAPASTLYQWKAEYERWTNNPCEIFAGSPTKVDKAFKNWTHGAVISYDMFKDTQVRDGKVHEILKANPDAIILDEAHKIKNPKSECAKSAFLCTKIPVRYALTGTPAPNKAHEIFSILKFLKPKEYSSYWKFINNYFYQQELYGQYRTYIEVQGFKPGMEYKLQSELNDFCIQRKRIEVMQWLPQKEYITVSLELTREQKKHISELEKYFETENVVVQGVLDRLIRYRQLCLSPKLLQLKGKSPKLEYVIQHIQDYPEEPIIVFSKFTSFLKMISEELDKCKIKHGMIIGETSIEDRNIYKESFQDGSLNVVLIQIDAGKEGLTLDRGETIIFTDKFPPFADIAQAEDRFVATTEDKKEKPHTVISLVMKDSYDEVVEEMIKQRASEVDVINNFRRYLNV